MDPDRIHVFHVADRDRSIVTVPDDLIFDLLIASDAFLHQDLMHRRKLQGILHDRCKFPGIICKTPSGAAKGKSRPKHDGIPDLSGSGQSFLYGGSCFRGQHRFSQFNAKLLEQFPVLCPFNRSTVRTQQLCSALFQDSLFLKLHGKVEPCLASYPRKDGIRTFKAYDPGQIFQCQRLHVDLIRNRGIRHDRCRIGVAQNDLISLFPKRQTRLCSCIVKFSRLSDDDGTGAYDQYFSDVCSLWHMIYAPSIMDIKRSNR